MKIFKPVVRIKLLTGRKKIYDSLEELREDKNFSLPPVYECLNKKRKEYKGYTWRYVND